VAAHAAAAAARGAVLREREAVTGWRVDAGSGDVLVTTARATYQGRRLVVTAGAWIPQLVPQLRARPRGPDQVRGVRESQSTPACKLRGLEVEGAAELVPVPEVSEQVWHPHDWLASAYGEAA
jgi:glycine/D-amino acid oxidase-like deaminating enzyme